MTPPLSPADAEAIRSLIVEFHYLIDHGRATECLPLFAPDASLTFAAGSPKPGTIAGLDGIRDFLIARQGMTALRTRHVVSNTRLVAEGPDRVAAMSILTVFRCDDGTSTSDVAFVGDLDEIYVRTAPGAWRIKVRTFSPVFARA